MTQKPNVLNVPGLLIQGLFVVVALFSSTSIALSIIVTTSTVIVVVPFVTVLQQFSFE